MLGPQVGACFSVIECIEADCYRGDHYCAFDSDRQLLMDILVLFLCSATIQHPDIKGVY